MALPHGMMEASLEIAPERLAEYGLEELPRGVVFGKQFEDQFVPTKGDGWVTNTWRNRQLSGNVTQWRRNTVPGQAYRREFLSIDSALLEVEQLYVSINAEIDRVAEAVEQAQGVRIGLGHWLTLSETEKSEMKAFFGGVAEQGARARNPFNVAAAAQAARMSSLKDRLGRDNPGAIRAMSPKLERPLIERYNEVVGKVLPANNGRRPRLLKSAFDENYHIGSINAIIDSMVSGQTDYDLINLQSAFRNNRYRVGPGNLLAHTIYQTDGRLEDLAPLETTQAGFRLERLNSYLMLPFRILTSLNQDQLDRKLRRSSEQVLADVAECSQALQEIDIDGPYARHIGRVIAQTELVTQAIEAGDSAALQHGAVACKQLIELKCLPGDSDAEKAPWYQHQMPNIVVKAA